MHKYKLAIRLLLKVFQQEKGYIFGSFIIFSALLFILFALYIAKEIYTDYANANSMLLPEKIAFVDKNPKIVLEQLHQHGITQKDVLVGGVKKIKKAKIFLYEEDKKVQLLPIDLTLMNFIVPKKITIDVECDAQKYHLQVKKIALKSKKRWTFQTEPFECSRKSNLFLLTKKKKVPLHFIKKRKRYSKFFYQTDLEYDKPFYSYLIKLANASFLTYYPVTRDFLFFKNITPDTQKYARTLNSYFSVIFSSKKNTHTLINSSGYEYMTDFERISLKVFVKIAGREKKVIIKDSIPYKMEGIEYISKYIMIGNYNSFDMEYDKTFIYVKNKEVSLNFLGDVAFFSKEQFISEIKEMTQNINLLIYGVSVLLFIFSASIVASFLTRIYNAYKNIFSHFIFYGLLQPVMTYFIIMLILFALGVAYFLSYKLIEMINGIFQLYYIDLISFNVNSVVFLLYIILMGVVGYIVEKKQQRKLLETYRG